MNKLKELRKQNKITQEEIAKHLNITQVTYGRYELGTSEPSLETLCKIADYYNTSLDYIVGRTHKNEIGYLKDYQIEFVKAFLQLNDANQRNTAIYVATLLAKQ